MRSASDARATGCCYWLKYRFRTFGPATTWSRAVVFAVRPTLHRHLVLRRVIRRPREVSQWPAPALQRTSRQAVPSPWDTNLEELRCAGGTCRKVNARTTGSVLQDLTFEPIERNSCGDAATGCARLPNRLDVANPLKTKALSAFAWHRPIELGLGIWAALPLASQS